MFNIQGWVGVTNPNKQNKFTYIIKRWDSYRHPNLQVDFMQYRRADIKCGLILWVLPCKEML
jgi:hypothetical protein